MAVSGGHSMVSIQDNIKIITGGLSCIKLLEIP